MKVVTLFGTRPEIIRLSEVIKTLDPLCEQILVHTGQNYHPNLSDVFFKELALRRPDLHLKIESADFSQQASQILSKSGELLRRLQPDRLLILGDTNSGLAAIVAARLGIPVYHMEAGNRAYDNRVPEELNRRLIDHASDVLMPYTHRSKENLLREGIPRQRIFVVGNPIGEVLRIHDKRIRTSRIMTKLGLNRGKYFLVTLHRAENVDAHKNLTSLWQGLELVAREYKQPVIVSLHPRTASKIKTFGRRSSPLVRVFEPFGLFDFVHLEKNARCVLSDSGTVQEECCLFGVANVTIRNVTERAETVECGSSILSGQESERVLASVRVALSLNQPWSPPVEYLEENVARTVAKIVLGFSPLPSHVAD